MAPFNSARRAARRSWRFALCRCALGLLFLQLWGGGWGFGSSGSWAAVVVVATAALVRTADNVVEAGHRSAAPSVALSSAAPFDETAQRDSIAGARGCAGPGREIWSRGRGLY